jgi:hypothetical protein
MPVLRALLQNELFMENRTKSMDKARGQGRRGEMRHKLGLQVALRAMLATKFGCTE